MLRRASCTLASTTGEGGKRMFLSVDGRRSASGRRQVLVARCWLLAADNTGARLSNRQQLAASREPIVDRQSSEPHTQTDARTARNCGMNVEIVYAADGFARKSRLVEVVDVAVGGVEEIEEVERDADR